LIVDPREAGHQNVYKLMIGSILPRPIAFVSTISIEGVRNLAPFSFFTGICSNPPMVCFAPTSRRGVERRKDTLRNITETKEFVVNVVSEAIAEQMNITSAEFPPEVDEFEAAGLTAAASDLVKPPRVAESPVSMECRLHLNIEFSELPGGGSLVIGEVVRFHVADGLMEDFRVDPDKLRAVGRMGGASYARTRDRFDMIRPK